MNIRRPTSTGAAASLAALGVVFGDIGTSPLYALSTVVADSGARDTEMIFGATSLVIWSLGLVVTVLYVSILMRHDNEGEGGLLALFSLVRRSNPSRKLGTLAISIAAIGAAMFLGDSLITPAISVLSAVEGVTEVAPHLHALVVPVTILILLGVFFIQKFGTARIGVVFGPLMLLWFTVLAAFGAASVARTPLALEALSPHWILLLFAEHPWAAVLALGGVVLAITGAEALFADMGHFGRRPITLAWFLVVFPALILTYLGQSAAILRGATGIPLYAMVPSWATLPMVFLATIATVIASQAVISGAFSVVKQAGRLGLLPRLRIIHTSTSALGQIYIPSVTAFLLVGTITLVLTFRSSAALASAYGIAVIITMATSALMLILLFFARGERYRLEPLVTRAMFALILIFLVANLPKVATGGWLPLATGIILVVTMWTWHRGLARLDEARQASEVPLGDFLRRSRRSPRVPGTAVFLARTADVAPASLLSVWEQTGVLVEDLVIVAMRGSNLPFEHTVRTRSVGKGVTMIEARIGFMLGLNVRRVLELAGERFTAEGIRFGVSSNTPEVNPESPMPMWQQRYFVALERLRPDTPVIHGLPPGRTIVVGRELPL